MICPLMSGHVSVRYENTPCINADFMTVECYGNQCAMWEANYNGCSLQAGVMKLRDVEEIIGSIARELPKLIGVLRTRQ